MEQGLPAGLTAYHHSRLTAYRSPGGAVQAGTTVTLAMDVGGALAEAIVSLRLWLHDREVYLPMERREKEWGARWCISLKMPDRPGLIWYYFRIATGEETLYYGAESGAGRLMHEEPPGYQVTIYEPGFSTPRWFREGIIYQIFPDRFSRAGDPAAGLAYHRGLGRAMRYHEDWCDAPAYLPEPGEEHYSPNDFFGGTLRGIQEQLPYLKSLGVGCLYLNPIFESASNHRYDTADYRRIDPLLGTEEDLRALAEAAREAGIRLMLDGVFSHTGDDSRYFDKYGRYPDDVGAYESAESPYRSWYTFGEYPPAGYKSWWGFPKLPEVDESEPSYAEFICDAERGVLAHWAAHGITSWRLDVADELPDAFIESIRTRLMEIDPESVVIGEVWEDASTKEAYGVRRKYVYGRELTGVMNYPFRDAAAEYFLGRIDAYALNERLQMLRERYPKPFWYACMNLLSTHDSVRAITLLGGAPSRHEMTREEQAVYRLSHEQERLGKARFFMATALQMALPGVPSIYYGDEAGLRGMADPFNRGTYPWGREDLAVREVVRALGRARSTNPALKAGLCTMGALHEDVFAILRQAGPVDAFGAPCAYGGAALLLNRAQEPRVVTLRPELLPEGDALSPLEGEWQDVLSGRTLRAVSGGLMVTMPPLTGMLFLKKES